MVGRSNTLLYITEQHELLKKTGIGVKPLNKPPLHSMLNKICLGFYTGFT